MLPYLQSNPTRPRRFAPQSTSPKPGCCSRCLNGLMFEELIRKFNEALNENPGEHFTPRDVEAEIRDAERDIVRMLAEVIGSRFAGE
jgi:hypothetical protein